MSRLAKGCGALALTAALTGAFVAIPLVAATAVAPPTTYTIGVDHSTPSGHNFEYVDFLPRADVKIHAGDLLDFAWANTPDGLHTATLLQPGETPAAKWAANPLAVPDLDDPPVGPHPQLEINPAIGAPTNPFCGTLATPCAFDGSSDLNSGATPTNTGAHFFVKVNATPGTYHYICLIHQGMQATFTVVGPNAEASTPSEVLEAARDQGATDTKGALDAEEDAPPPLVHHNPDGTRSITVTAGTATPFVEVAEMLPRRIKVHPGDTLTWVNLGQKDPHTVTFPTGNDPATEPLPAVCEGNPDTPAPCANPAAFENHLNPDPVGPTVISSPLTVATSGVFFPGGSTPAPYSFPNAGTFTYQCRIHDHMIGTVVVKTQDDQQN
jgi:plastocyanin